MENEKDTDPLEMSVVEFDAWLRDADTHKMVIASRAIMKKLDSGEKLSAEDLRRITAFRDKTKKLCRPVRLAYWAAHDLPWKIIDVFQAYLIISKLFGFGPFCEMSWTATVSPSLIAIAALAVFALYDASSRIKSK